MPADRLLHREGHPLGLPRTYAEEPDYAGPAEEIATESGASRRWTFGVAAGALLVAGTFAAGALGLHNASQSVAGETAPEHAPPSAPGHGPNDAGVPPAAAPVDKGDKKPAKPAPAPEHRAAPAGQHAQGSPGAANGGASTPRQQAPAPAPAPAPQPAPQQPAPQQPAPQQPDNGGGLVGTVGDTVGGLGDTVGDTVGGLGDVVGGLGDTVGGLTGALSGGGGQQPAMTMINPVGDLLGG